MINRFSRLFQLSVLLLLLCFARPILAQALNTAGQWFQAPPDWVYAGQPELNNIGLTPVRQLNKTGGHYFYETSFNINTAETLVVDFKNSSVIGRFYQRVFDSQNHLMAYADGGIQSGTTNPFFLRHGRTFSLQPGRYRLVTEVISPFFLAQPTPYLDSLAHYQQAIKPGDALTLLCLGVLLGLMFYYAALGLFRRNLTDTLYALFILGNLLYNGMALLVYADLFHMHWFFLISAPILFSNAVYILFVLNLLDIRQDTNPRLWRSGMILLALFTFFIGLAMFKPNWSLEIDRTGVALFMGFGLISGLVRARDGHHAARMYLLAISIFFMLGVTSISLGRMNDIDTLYIEHLGLVAVTVEALLLALVLASQFVQLQRSYNNAQKSARCDALTGLLNKRAFFDAGLMEIERSKRYTHPLAVVYLDLDHFKQLNDTQGHAVGDVALLAVSRALLAALRSNDKLSRLGGDEFAILLPEINFDGANEIGRKILLAVSDALQYYPPVTASIGIIWFEKTDRTFPDMLKAADELMYEVKHNGKNNVTCRRA